MNRKTTVDLLHEIITISTITEFFKNNSNEMNLPSLSVYLNQLLQEKNLSKSYLAKNSGLDKHYVYHILAGLKNPSRTKVLAIALAIHLTLNETQRALKYAHAKELYIRDKWDSLIIYALNHKLSVLETNELLDEFHIEILK